MMKTPFHGVSFLFALFLSLSVFAASPVGDLDGNYLVDFDDMVLFFQQWMLHPDCFGAPGCGDLDGEDGVNIEDFALAAQHWLERGEITLVINELMASNGNTLEDPDEQGEYPDWIEIYNYGNEAVTLAGMYLQDDNNLWRIPAGISIQPDEHVLFWADDDDEQGSYHTTLKLNKADDEVTLLAYDGETIIDTISFSDQLTNISYGRYPDASDDWYSMDSPSPYVVNNVGMAGDVYFSSLGGTFTSNFVLTLSTLSAAAEIRYTTDGSIPTPSSTLYTGPIMINNSRAIRIRARTYDSTLAPGLVHTEVYIPLAPNIQSFNSNLPIVVIDSFGTDINNNGGTTCWNFNYTLQNVAAVFIDIDKTGQANITGLADFAGRAGMKIRGESSRCWAKRQYSFETWGEAELEDKSVSLLGLPSDSDWVLNAPFSDKTLLRNVLSFKWFNDIGQYAPRTRLVEVFFNDNNGITSSSDYRGVYVLMEKIKVGKDRVDIAKMDSGDMAEPDITGGYVLRHDKNNGQEIFYTTANMIGDFQYYDPDEFELTSTQKNWIRNWLNEFESVLNSSSSNDPIRGYAKYVDVDEFIKYDLLLEIQKNADGHKLSLYMHKDRNGKLAMGPMWDCNLAYGNTWMPGWGFPDYYSMASTTNERWFNDGFRYAWYNRMLQDPDYMIRYADMWFSLRETVISDESIQADFDYYYDLLDSDGPGVDSGGTPADRNFARWNINQILPGNLAALGSFDAEVEWLKTWIYGNGTAKGTYSDRLQWVDELWESDRSICAPPTLKANGTPLNQGGQVNVDTTLTMSADCSGTIYYTNDGTDPRSWTTVSTSHFDTVLVAEGAPKAVHIPAGPVSDDWKGGNEPFGDSTWTNYSFVAGKPGSVGYENSTGYAGLISYDVGGNLYNNNNTQSCLIRIPFSVDAGELADMDYMILRMRHDDAFVAYINGTEVYRSEYVPNPLEWSSAATYYSSEATNLVDYDIKQFIGELRAGSNNVLAIHGLNFGPTSSDFLISARLEAGAGGPGGITPGGAISPGAIEYTGSINLTESEYIKARLKNGANWGALNEACYSVGPVADSLRVTEIMYHPADPNHEFIEVKNIGAGSINLAWVKFTDGVDFTFPSLSLEGGGYAVVVRNQSRFEALYGTGPTIAGEFTGALDNGGEEIVLRDAFGVEILDFDYDDDWHPVTDGAGFSLNIINPSDPDTNNWDDKDSWQAGSVANGSPGSANPANIAANGAIVINEILTHSNGYPNDWIELHNTTGSRVDIGGWFLSDDRNNLKKYRIAAGQSIAAYGYKVFTQDDNFGSLAADPGRLVAFGLSELGESVYLSSGTGGNLGGGYSVREKFGAAQWDVSFGRYVKSAAANYDVDFVAMQTITPQTANSGPFVEDVVIDEIMYNPSLTYDKLGEYVELKNRTDSVIRLFDAANPSNTWRFTKGIDYTFPTDVSIPPEGSILVVRTHPEIFRAVHQGVPGDVGVYGPFVDSKLENDGEKIELSRPGDPEPGGFVPYIRVEQVNYSDGTHPVGDDPWPTSADGDGKSLNRISQSSYANDVSNWTAATPTPGL